MRDELLTTREVADLLKVPVATLYAWRSRPGGGGPRAVRVGKHLRWRLDDVNHWLLVGGSESQVTPAALRLDRGQQHVSETKRPDEASSKRTSPRGRRS